MKYYIVTITLCLCSINVCFSQIEEKKVSNYEEAIKAGASKLNDGKFNEALEYYFMAQAYNPKKREAVQDRIELVFDEIQKLKETAEKNAEEANRLKEAAENAYEDLKEAQAGKKEAIKEAKKAAADAIAAKTRAEIEKLKSEKEAFSAKIATISAILQEQNAINAKKQTAKLEMEALSTATALKSIGTNITYQPELKIELAQKAYELQDAVSKSKNEVPPDSILFKINTLYEDIVDRNEELKDSTSQKIKKIVHDLDSMQSKLDSLKKSLENESTKEILKKDYPPSIYTSLYEASLFFKNEGFDEIKRHKNRHIGPIRTIIQRDSNLYTLGSGGRLINWKVDKSKKNGEPERLDIKGRKCHSEEQIYITATLCTLQNDTFIAIGSRFSTVEMIHSENKKKNYTLKKIKEVHQLEYHNNKLYALQKDGDFIIYDLLGNKILSETKVDTTAQHFSIDTKNNIIAISQDTIVLLYQFRENFTSYKSLDKEIIELDKDNYISTIKFDVENQQLSVGTSNGYVWLLPFQKDKYVIDTTKKRQCHHLLISDIDFKTYNGKTKMALGCYDGTVSIWDMSKFEDDAFEPLILNRKNNWVSNVCFDSEYNHLITGYYDGTIKFWNLDIETLAEELKRYKNNKLTTSEKERFSIQLEMED